MHRFLYPQALIINSYNFQLMSAINFPLINHFIKLMYKQYFQAFTSYLLN